VVLTASIVALMTEAVSTSETSVRFYQNLQRSVSQGIIFMLAAVRTLNLTGNICTLKVTGPFLPVRELTLSITINKLF
jgi:hypothetical protein